MREPAARRDLREIDLPAPARERRPAPAARRRPVPEASALGETVAVLGALSRRAGLVCLRRPGAVLGGVAILGVAVAVSVNALGYQTGRHPAPIFPKPLPRQEAARRPATPDTQPARIAERPPEPKSPETHAAERAETRTAARDAIGELIRAGETTASVTPAPSRAKAEPRPEPAVSQAQRALAKLGYGPIKADGMMGTATRIAIEKFERDRKLPVTGAAAGRTLRELAARSALPPG